MVKAHMRDDKRKRNERRRERGPIRENEPRSQGERWMSGERINDGPRWENEPRWVSGPRYEMGEPRSVSYRTRESDKGSQGYSTRAHGDLGYVGERVKDSGYNMTEGGCVDHMLTSDVLPSCINTMRWGMRSDRDLGIPRSDLPLGREPLQSGPVFGDVKSRDHSGGNWASWPTWDDRVETQGRGRRPGKARKGEY